MTTAAATGGALDLRLLGPLEASRAGSPISLGGTRQRALLAILLLHANETRLGRRARRGALGCVAPDAPGPRAPGVRLPAPETARGQRDPDTRAGVLRGDCAGDLGHPPIRGRDRASRRALDAGDARAGLVFADEALALWRGQPLADFAYEPFALPHAARLEELRLLALEQRAEARIALEPHPDVVADLEDLRREHPLRERLTELLMLALYRAGRQAEALDVYRATHERLGDELGLEPGPSLAALNRAILNHDPDLGRTEAAAPPPSRSHRLRPLDVTTSSSCSER